MAGRNYKVGLDYFELCCHLDDEVKLVQAEYGLKAFAVIVKLWQKIYGERGYYCEWNDDTLLLFMSENGLIGDGNKNLIKDIVSACTRRNIFSAELFKKYGILTSSGVQKRYLKAVSKRESVELIKEYLLISVGKNKENVVIKSISGGRNTENDTGNAQSRVEKSREENNTMCTEARALFERLWELYPCKKGKASVSDTQKRKLLKIGYDEIKRAIDRYVKYVENADYDLHYKNGSTFFNSGYVDYLDANYTPDKGRPSKRQAGQFNQYMQQDYDFEQLEKEILSN